MKLTELRQALAEAQIEPTKSLGQNFLHDANQLSRIVRQAELGRADRVLEVGPGLGPLTERLIASAHQVLAIEKDRRLLAWLHRRFADAPNLALVQGDALQYLQDQPMDWSGWKVVANLPYVIASRLLVDLAQRPDAPSLMVVTVQKEVAERIEAAPGNTAYGQLSLLLQWRYAPVASFKIPAACFHPRPDIDSACVKLTRRLETWLVPPQDEVFRRVVRRGFSQRRKMLVKLLKADWPEEHLRWAFAQLGLSPQVRAERVSLDQFIALAKLLLQGETGTVPMPEEIFEVVNERDEVIGQRTRREVHALGLRHRAVHVLLFNARGELFLQKRSQHKDTFPGAWDSSSSGHLNPGESYEACAVREAREELGVALAQPLERLFKIDACPETGQEFVWVFRSRTEGPFALNTEEIETGAWFAPDQLTCLLQTRPDDFASTFPLIWGRLFSAARDQEV